MKTRQKEIADQMTQFLLRCDVPTHLKGDDKSGPRSAEQIAIIQAVEPMLPDEGYADVLNCTFRDIQAQAKSRFWPTVHTFQRAVERAMKGRTLSSKQNACILNTTVAGITAKEPIPEHWLFGKKAAELCAAGVTRGQLNSYRQQAYDTRHTLYGDENAKQWLMREKARHRAELAERNQEPQPYNTNALVTKAARKSKPPKLDWGWC